MAKFIIQGLLLITAAALMVEASVSVGVTACTNWKTKMLVAKLMFVIIHTDISTFMLP